MSAIQDLFQRAQLSEAAYGRFVSNAGNLLSSSDDVKAALRDAGNNMNFTSDQAANFVTQWRVLDQ